jgi:hypothetical protein
MASDVFFEDVQRRQIDEYGYELLGSDKFDGQDCFLIEAKPTAKRLKDHSPYGKSHLWVRKDIQAIVKMRHFDRDMKPLKEIEAKQWVKVKGASHRANLLVITDVKRRHRTTLQLGNRKLMKNVDSDAFSPNTLRRLVE